MDWMFVSQIGDFGVFEKIVYWDLKVFDGRVGIF